jgi:hypothetical protein
MAIVESSVWELYLKAEDNNGHKSGVSFYAPGALTLTEASDVANVLMGSIRLISDAAWIGYTVTKTFDETDNALLTPVASSEVERKLALSAGTKRKPALISIQVPSPSFVLDQNGTDIANQVNPQLMIFKGIIINGPAGAGNGPVSSRGEPVEICSLGVIRHRTLKPKA